MAVKVRNLIRRLKENGFEEVRQTGSHKIFFNKELKRTVIVPDHGNGTEIPTGTEKSILKQSGLL